MKKKILSILMVCALLVTSCFCNIQTNAESGVKVTGVGIFDSDPAKGIHTFSEDAKLIQVTFNDPFWTAAETADWVEWEASINDYLLINGKKPQEWIDASWGSVQIHVKKSASLGQYMEINVSGYAGLPTETTDWNIEILSGFAGTVTEGGLYEYVAANGNVPAVKKVEEQEPVKITGVGIFDQTPNKGIHTFDDGSRLLQVTFSSDFWATDTESYVELNELVNTKLLINGKTPSQWVGEYGSATWGCVVAHVKRNDTLGQYLELSFANNSNVVGLPTETEDWEITFLSGFADVVGEDITYVYKVSEGNVPANEKEIYVTGVGIFDQTPNKGIHTFDDGNKLIQVKFNDVFWKQDETQSFVELEDSINTKLLINGKTPSQWVGEYGSATWGCITAHVAKDDTLGQYLQLNLSALEGVLTEMTDVSITFLEGFAGTLTETSVWVYNKGENKPFEKQKCDENGVAVTGVGIFDQAPSKGIHTYDNGKTIVQITFNRSFWTTETESWVQYQEKGLTDYIKINGRTITDLVNQYGDDCIFMHVQYDTAIGGQYLYLEFNPDEVAVNVGVNNTISILEGFPIANFGTLGCSYYYNYVADNNLPFYLNDSIISGVGVFDQMPAKGIHTYEGGRTMVTATFEETFWSSDTQDWVQYADYGLTPCINVNGRSIASWVEEFGDSAVYMHVRKDGALGQYLYFEFSNTVPGLVVENMDNIITFTKDFPIHGQGTLEKDVSFTYQANENRPFVMNNADYTLFDAPYSKIAGNYLLWNFENTAENFQATNNAILVVKGDSIRYTASNGSELKSGDELKIPADKVKFLEFRLKTSNASSITMKWDNGKGFNADNQVSIDLKADNKYHIYQINMTTVDNWKGFVNQLAFVTADGSLIEIEQISVTGTSISVFPWISGNFDEDVSLLLEIKNQLATEENAFSIGFSGVVQYLTDVDENGNYRPSGNYRDAAYFVRLAKATDMPVTIWLRADPWGEVTTGVASSLYEDDKNVMWTEEQIPYRYNETGYYMFSLALKDINGNKTDYWAQTEKLLAQCSSYVADVVNANPEYVEGVTTTSEYRFLSKNKEHYLDYNPNTINEFRSYAQERYSTIDAFNNAYGTEFTSWNLKYTDYDATVDNVSGFDAPRDQSNTKFAELWTEFRANQIHNALTIHVDVINDYIDSALIYTHQIVGDSFEYASPVSTGNVEGSNIGIDMHNGEGTDEVLTEIRSYIDDDITRTWAVPEYIPVGATNYATTYAYFSAICQAGAKIVGPFNYGSSDVYALQGTESFEAISTYVKAFIGDINDDNMMDVRDIVRMKKYLAPDGSSTVEINDVNSDLTGDKAITIDDLKRLRRYLLFS